MGTIISSIGVSAADGATVTVGGSVVGHATVYGRRGKAAADPAVDPTDDPQGDPIADAIEHGRRDG